MILPFSKLLLILCCLLILTSLMCKCLYINFCICMSCSDEVKDKDTKCLAFLYSLAKQIREYAFWISFFSDQTRYGTEHPDILFFFSLKCPKNHIYNTCYENNYIGTGVSTTHIYLVWLEKKEIQKVYSIICLASEYKTAKDLKTVLLWLFEVCVRKLHLTSVHNFWNRKK